VVQLPGRDSPVLINVSVEMKRQIVLLFVIGSEALSARMVLMFEFGSYKTSA
jgi:hypothetical protein